MAARFNVIQLETDKSDPLGNTTRFVMWADVPSARQVFFANAGITASAWKDAQAGDIAALASGAVVERVSTVQMPPGALNATLRLAMQAQWVAFQAEVNSNLWSKYGSTWVSGGGWVAGGVA